MKAIFLTIAILAGLSLHAQEKTNLLYDKNNPFVYVFNFDKNTDDIVYEEIQGKTILLYYRILLNNKKVKFYFFKELKKNKKIKTNTTRNELEEIVRNDSDDKPMFFCIYVKEKHIYCIVDHIPFRSVPCG